MFKLKRDKKGTKVQFTIKDSLIAKLSSEKMYMERSSAVV